MRKKKSLKRKLTLIYTLTIFFSVILITLISIVTIHTSIYNEKMSLIKGISYHLLNDFKEKYNGVYTKKGDKFYCDDEPITEAQQMLEKTSEYFNVECTIFIDNERAFTTLKNESGYIIGTKQDDKKITSCVFQGNEYQGKNVIINDLPYHCVYIPLTDIHNQVAGMIFVGIDNMEYYKIILQLVYQILVTAIVITIITCIIITIFSTKITDCFSEITAYLKALTERQTTDVKMKINVLQRNDEIGELAVNSVKIGTKLKALIGRDYLTGLYNRRTSSQYMQDMWKNTKDNSSPFTIVMSDIDFFKKINDKYGHEVGDEVLIKVSDVLRKHTPRNSIAIRWGGEEFIIAMDADLNTASTIAKNIAEEISNHVFETDEDSFSLTMTFGIQTYENQSTLDELIMQADQKLYYGKEHGRNTIIV